MVEVAPALAGTGIKMTKQIHDQLVFQVPHCQVDKMLGIPKIMEDVFPQKNGMRMKADMAWSDRSFAEADMKKGFYGL
jgi:DNA polymerase I-like protein with 3'-5' exonuclease and polymerase domains